VILDVVKRYFYSRDNQQFLLAGDDEEQRKYVVQNCIAAARQDFDAVQCTYAPDDSLIADARLLATEWQWLSIAPWKFVEDIAQGPSSITLIFTYDVLGNLRLAAEDPGAHRRPTHSQLAQGVPVMAAGELVFELHTKRRATWVLAEINNGSGHYRPKARSLDFALKLFSNEFSIQSMFSRDQHGQVNVRLRDKVKAGIKLASW